MGGSLNFVFRDENGKVDFREIYTGGMKYIQMSSEVVELHTSPMRYCNEWYGKESILNYKNGVSPDGYGLLVIDYLKNEMYAIQGYCGIGNAFSLLIQPSNYFGIEDEIAQVKHLIEVGRVTKISMGHAEKEKTLIHTKEKPITVKSAIKFVGKELATFTFDTSPLKVTRWEESKQGYKELKKHMIAAGFKIDKAKWAEFVKDTHDCCYKPPKGF